MMCRGAVPLCLLLCCCTYVVAPAATTRYVPVDYPTIQAAITACGSQDTVVVAKGTYLENIDFGSKQITVKSTYETDPSAVAETIINGNQKGPAVTFSASCTRWWTRLAGFTVTNGKGTGGGGIRCAFYSSPGITACVISGNAANTGGGLYCSQHSSPALSNCTISGNSGAYGGGVDSDASSAPEFTDCTISDNTTSGYGGGLYCTGGSVTLNRCVISGNTATLDGGGLNGSCRVYNSTLSDNTSGGSGGGASGAGTSIADLRDCTISGNVAVNGGGACESGILRCTISNNSARNGGGAYNCDIIDSTICDNVAVGSSYSTGGGVYSERTTLSGNTITRNTATYRGGGACLLAVNPTGNVVTHNSTSGDGGGLYCCGLSDMSNNLIADNTADRGGGVYFFESAMTGALPGVPEGSNNTIAHNTAAVGGAAYCDRDTTTLENCIIAYNDSTSSGAIHCDRSCLGFAYSWFHGNVGGNLTGDYILHGTPPRDRSKQGRVKGPAAKDADDPLFVDLAAGDYRLKSTGGHWDGAAWVIDPVTSPCVDAGDPNAPCGNEPAPNGGRLNLGFDGNTAYASKTANRAPTVPPTVTIAPSEPTCTASLAATASGSTDPDGTTPTFRYEWAPGSGEWGHACTDGILTGVTLHKTELWRVRACATDGYLDSAWTEPVEVTIGNSAPEVPTAVSIAPESPTTLDDLTATSAGSTDADDDSLSYSYEWAVKEGDGDWSGWEHAGGTLAESLTQRDQQWKCRGRAFDGEVYGPWLESLPVTVRNSAPAPPVTVAISPAHPNTLVDLRAVFAGASDADGDLLSYQSCWSRSTDGGTTWSRWSKPIKLLDSSLTARAEQWRVQVRCGDGTVFSPWVISAPVTVRDTAPGRPTDLAVTPEAPGPDDDLTASAGGSGDPDAADAVSYEYRWRRSRDRGATWSAWRWTGAVLPALLTAPHQLWQVSARATDGTLASGWYAAAPVTIGPPAPPPLSAAGGLTVAAAPAANDTVSVSFTLASPAAVEVVISNLAGRTVAVLPQEERPAGVTTVVWNGRGGNGRKAPAGVYLVKVRALARDGSCSRTLAAVTR